MPTFSAVLTHYDCGRFLPDAVRSVLEQELPPEEILVVDDGSTDGSREKIRPFEGRARWIEVPHGGQAAALNAVLPMCRGDWVAFLETDDTWSRGKLAAVAEAVRSAPDAVSVQNCLVQADADLRPLPTRLPETLQRWSLEDFLRDRALLTGMSGLAVRRDVLSRVLPLPSDVYTAVDELLQPRLLKHGPMLHLPGAYGLRRLHGANQYGGAKADLARLSAYLDLRDRLDAHAKAFLEENGLAVSDGRRRRLRRERLEMELIRHRLEGRLWRALADWRDILKECGSARYAAFKAASQAVALVSPALFLRLHEAYEHGGLGVLRRRLLP